MASLKKNVAGQNVTFALISATTGAGLTGATVTVYITKDAVAQVITSATVTEQGHGQYNLAPLQADTNATDVGFLFVASSAIPSNADFHTDVVDSNGYLDVNLVDIAGSAVSTTSAQLGVNVVEYNAQTAQTDANNLPKVDVEDVVGVSVSTSTAQFGVNVVKINQNATAAVQVAIANATIGRGTCTTGGSTTSVTTSVFTPNGAAAGQFIGRTMIFDYNTATPALQGQATTITGSTNAANPTFTVVALTTAPSSGDIFGVY